VPLIQLHATAPVNAAVSAWSPFSSVTDTSGVSGSTRFASSATSSRTSLSGWSARGIVLSAA
jgi:hypothetical protein